MVNPYFSNSKTILSIVKPYHPIVKPYLSHSKTRLSIVKQYLSHSKTILSHSKTIFIPQQSHIYPIANKYLSHCPMVPPPRPRFQVTNARAPRLWRSAAAASPWAPASSSDFFEPAPSVRPKRTALMCCILNLLRAFVRKYYIYIYSVCVCWLMYGTNT